MDLIRWIKFLLNNTFACLIFFVAHFMCRKFWIFWVGLWDFMLMDNPKCLICPSLFSHNNSHLFIHKSLWPKFESFLTRFWIKNYMLSFHTPGNFLFSSSVKVDASHIALFHWCATQYGLIKVCDLIRQFCFVVLFSRASDCLCGKTLLKIVFMGYYKICFTRLLVKDFIIT